MKKVVRTVWISVLTGLAFLAVACTCQNKLPKKVRKELMDERKRIEVQISESQVRERDYWNAPYMQDLFSYDDLDLKRHTCQDLIEIKREQIALFNRLNEIDTMLADQNVAIENNDGINQAGAEIKRIEDIIEKLIPPCVYGPPPTELIQE